MSQYMRSTTKSETFKGCQLEETLPLYYKLVSENAKFLSYIVSTVENQPALNLILQFKLSSPTAYSSWIGEK